MFGRQVTSTTVQPDHDEQDTDSDINPDTGWPWTDRELRYIQRQKVSDNMASKDDLAQAQEALDKKWTELQNKEKDYQTNKTDFNNLADALTKDKEEYKKNRQTLKNLQATLSQNEQEFKKNKDALKKQIDALTQDEDTYQTNVQALVNRQQQLTKALTDVDQQERDLKQKQEDYDNKYQDFEQERDQKIQDLDSLEASLKVLKEDISSIQQRIGQQTTILTTLKEEYAKKQDEHRQMEDQVQTLETSLTQLHREVKAKQSLVTASKQDLLQSQKEYEEQEEILKKKKEELQQKMVTLEKNKFDYMEEARQYREQSMVWNTTEVEDRRSRREERLKQHQARLDLVEEQEKDEIERMNTASRDRIHQLRRSAGLPPTVPTRITEVPETPDRHGGYPYIPQTPLSVASIPNRQPVAAFPSGISPETPNTHPVNFIRAPDPSLAPKAFSGKTTEDGARFLAKFERYITVNGMDHKEMFPLYLTGSPDLWYNGYITQNAACSWEILRKAFLEHFGPEARGYVAQSELMTRQQAPDETVEDYSNDMMKRLGLAGCKEPLLWHTYVKGLRPQLQARVLAKHPKDIHTAEAYAKECEQLLKLEAKEQGTSASVNVIQSEEKPQWLGPFVKEMTKSMSKIVSNINPPSQSNDTQDSQNPTTQQRFSQPYFPNRRGDARPSNRQNTQQGSGPYCTFCKMPGHEYANCRRKFRVLRCWTCDEFGHFQADCPNQRRDQNNPQRQQNNQRGQRWPQYNTRDNSRPSEN